ncbi:alpha/beta hydrolase [Parvularcula maris]|uniref:Alpha/beta hydrolase n=1 Tax=Parvularcula maris TaxID=2965077 RepID=A0A9X2L8E6_9PROT|nr:alpha/beta hydrolase [Parvularcula maris]MCQ8184975.1 alpha/beta hydrolase [Parvularcula maris]
MLTIDPDLFRPDAISPETQAMNDKIEAFLKDKPTIMELGPVLVRELRAKGEGLLGKQPASELARWETAKALGLEVPVRVFRPEGDLVGVYLHIHGGGHTIGGADFQDQILEDYARRLSCAVVSVEYRLAPENPWPAPADDCEAAAVWLFETAGEMFGTEKIAVGGESAGGHLAAVTVLRMRDNHQKSFVGANLVYGVFDLSGTPALKNWGERNLVLNTPIVYWFAEQLLPKAQFEKADKTDPQYSPLYARLEGLCPALFSVGTADPIIDDTLFMAQRWVAAGNEAELEIYPGGIHAFDQIPGLTIAEEHHGAARAFLKSCFR